MGARHIPRLSGAEIMYNNNICDNTLHTMYLPPVFAKLYGLGKTKNS